jgi:cob(I)alamin adenosyltransferase
MTIYTFTGDDGTTSLPDGRRVPKDIALIEAYGSMDELNAWIGLLKDQDKDINRKEILLFIQDQIMRCSSALTTGGESKDSPAVLPKNNCVKVLEKEIDRMEKRLPPVEHFIIPGGNILVSYCHITRCVCRRAERSVIRLNRTEKSPDIIVKFLNRLSDFLYILSRQISLEFDIEEVKWMP